MITIFVWLFNKRSIKLWALIRDYPILLSLDIVLLVFVISLLLSWGLGL